VIKSFTANQAAEVTTKYLENEQFKEDVSKFIASAEIEESVTILLQNAVIQISQQQEIIDQLTTLSTELVSNLIQSEVPFIFLI
jgi:hypothetical protein